MKQNGRSGRRSGFTLVEILTAVAVIAILASIVTVGARSMLTSSKIKQTNVTLQNLKNMLAEFEVQGGRTENLYNFVTTNPLKVPSGVIENGMLGGSDFRSGTELKDTQRVMRNVTAVPSCRKMLDQFDKSMLMTDSSGNAMDPPVVLDAWGNPILFAGGRVGNSQIWGVTGLTSKAPGASADFRPADGKGVWISAGPDGDYSTGDDNLYSYEK